MRHPSLDRAPLLPNQLKHAVVNVWCARLEPAVDIQALRCLLSADELARAAQFRLDRHALEFVFGRAMLRRILASYTGTPAERISFVYGASGKPALAEQNGGHDIRFNLSHCARLLLCIVAWGREVGIDVEEIDARLASRAIAKLFFSAKETARLRAAPVGCAAKTFFTCWTRKEAYVKARGIGVALILPELDLPAAPTTSVHCDGKEWTLVSFTPAPGYVAAIAVEGSGVDLRLREYRMPKAGFSDARGEDRGNRAIHAGP
jgi:4'-phosphopantetheinyl transferase